MKQEIIKKKRGRPKLSDEAKLRPDWYLPVFDGTKKRKGVYWTDNRISELGDKMVTWFEENKRAVTLGKFCWEHKIPRQYIAKFGNKNNYFQYCIDIIKALLETRILQMGMDGEIDKVMAIFSLKNIAGWSDKKEISSTLEITSKIIELQLPKKNKIIEPKYEVVDDGKRKHINT